MWQYNEWLEVQQNKEEHRIIHVDMQTMQKEDAGDDGSAHWMLKETDTTITD